MTAETAVEKATYWQQTKDGDPHAYFIKSRHYSHTPRPRGNRHRFRIVGPSEYLLLVTADYNALFLWTAPKNGVRRDGQNGLNCAIFRNETDILSSKLILEAEVLAYRRWGPIRMFTYVDPTAVRSSNPGYCFKCAGWKHCGTSTRHKLVILEKYP
jgi:hypothetical protein